MLRVRRRINIEMGRYPAIRLSALLFIAACTPVTTRPRFEPFPEAQVLVVRGTPQRVTAEANAWLGTERVPVAFMSPIDGYLETGWHQGAKLRAGPIRPHRGTPGSSSRR